MTIQRVLLVSQDRWLVDKIREVLDAAGVETEIALSGAVAARVAVERRVDLLLDAAPGRIFKKCIVAVPLLIMLFIALTSKGDTGLAAYLISYYTDGSNINLAWRLKELLTFDNYFVMPKTMGDNIAFFFSMSVVGVVFRRLVSSREKRTDMRTSPGGWLVYSLLFCSLFCFMAQSSF